MCNSIQYHNIRRYTNEQDFPPTSGTDRFGGISHDMHNMEQFLFDNLGGGITLLQINADVFIDVFSVFFK